MRKQNLVLNMTLRLIGFFVWVEFAYVILTYHFTALIPYVCKLFMAVLKYLNASICDHAPVPEINLVEKKHHYVEVKKYSR